MNVPAGGEAATPSPTGRGGPPSAVPIPDPDASRRRILTASPPDAPNPAAPAFAEGSRAPAFIGSQLPGDKKSWKSASPSKAAAAPPPCGHKPGRRRHRRRNAFSFRVPRQGKGSLKPERKPPPCRPAPRRPLSNPPDEAAGVQLDIASSSSQGFRPSDGSKARCPACRPLRNGLSVRTAAYAAVRNDGAGFTGPRRPIFPKLAGPASGERRHPEPAPPVKGGHRKGGTGGNPRCNRGIRTLSRTLRGPSAKAQERTAQVQIGSAGGNRPPGTRRTETHRILRKAPPGSSGRLPPFRP